MSKYSELVYMVLDEIKGLSDDFTFTENHIIFLLDKYRGLLLKQKYADIRKQTDILKQVPDSNYQTINLNLIKTPTLEDCGCDEYLLKSTDKIPFLMDIGNPKVFFTSGYYTGEVAFVSKDRMKYTGHNKYLSNIIYCSIAPDNCLYLKSSNPQFLYLKEVSINGIFQNPKEVAKLQLQQEGCENSSCDIMDATFPLEDGLIPLLLEGVVKEIGNAAYRKEDTENNSSDDLEGLAVKASKK